MPAQKELTRPAGTEKRIWSMSLGVIAAFSYLLYHFWQLQVVQSQAFEDKAKENMVRQSTLRADRGIIYGRNGVVLADNRPSADIVFVPGECADEQQREEVCRRLEELLGIPPGALMKDVENHKGAPFTQLLVKQDVSKTDRFRVEERSFELPGVFSIVHPQRRYLQGQVAGQVLGFVNEISQKELEAEAKRAEQEGVLNRYKMGDFYGRNGVESYYENELKGTDGYMYMTKYAKGMPQMRTNRFGLPFIAPKDNLGQTLEPQGEPQYPVSGNSLYLTLDVGLQSFCERLLGTEVGAIVVLEAGTGAVRAVASTPTYDPGVFISGRNEEKSALYQAKEPMLNRAYQERFPPGSVFKVMMASAALEEGILDRNTTFYCPGQFKLPGVDRAWKCWNHSGHGSVNVVQALAFSCDVFFYNVGLKLGPTRMAEWAHKMGLGVYTGIDLTGEVPGRVPDPAWKAEINKNQPIWDQRWRDGDTVNVAIGQGDVVTTPLQIAVMMSCILNNGRLVRPFLNTDLGSKLTDSFLSRNTLDIVTEGMRMCVEKHTFPSGTGKEAFIEGFAILGKTGSAQVAELSKTSKYKTEEEIPRAFRDHAWFVAGVLDRDPRIAVCILVEHGLHGSSAAAPLAKAVIQYFYEHEAPGNTQETPVHLAQESH